MLRNIQRFFSTGPAMKTILLVHNSQAFLQRNSSLLSRAGFRILSATSASQALQMFQAEQIDLIISTLHLPDMGGDLLCSTIRQGGGITGLPFLLVCYEVDADLQRASRCGADGRLIKPVRPELLLDQVSRFLKIHGRRDYRGSLKTKINGVKDSLPFTGMTHNISVSGMLCQTATPLLPNDLVNNLLIPLDFHAIIADGKVVRSESRADGSYDCGVQFTNLGPGSRQRIESFLRNDLRAAG
jgi:CheY-like chemotaxis protein